MSNWRSTMRCFAFLALLTSVARAGDWPCFRGPGHQGESPEKSLPLRWDAATNVAWKTAIPGQGWSSPIVYGNRVFVTTATGGGASCHVMCLDSGDGRIVWDKKVFRQVLKKKGDENSYASPTPITDGQRVYATFADGSFVALTLDGNVIWTNRDFPHYSNYGLGASPILLEDVLIMSRDGTSETDEKVGWFKPWDRQFVVGLAAATGKLRWKTPRGMARHGYTTPNEYREGSQAIVISNTGDVVQGLDLRTGERIWWSRNQGEAPIPSPVLGDGMVFVTSGWEKPTTRAIRLGGKGDVTASHVAWEQTRGVSMIPSLVYISPWLFYVTEGAIAYCLNGRSGQVVWQSRLGGDYFASPVYADGHIYFLSNRGETIVIKAKGQFELVARNPLNEMAQASMAVSGGRFFIRTEQNLYCIGK